MKRLLPALLAGVLGWFAYVATLIIREEPLLAGGQADVAIVLGAAVRGEGTPSPVFEGRLEHGLSLVQRGHVRKLLLTGGRGEGMLVSEAAAGRRWAEARGLGPGVILVEERSRTTRQNLVEARRVMQQNGLATALIVSDPLHLPRAMRMAKDLGIEARPSPTTSSRYRSGKTRLPFLARESFFLTAYWLTGA